MCKSRKEGGIRCESHLAGSTRKNNAKLIASVLKEAGISLKYEDIPSGMHNRQSEDSTPFIMENKLYVDRIDPKEPVLTYSDAAPFMSRNLSAVDNLNYNKLAKQYFQTTKTYQEIETHLAKLEAIKGKLGDKENPSFERAYEKTQGLNERLMRNIEERTDVMRSIHANRHRSERLGNRYIAEVREMIGDNHSLNEYQAMLSSTKKFSETAGGRMLLTLAQRQHNKNKLILAVNPKAKVHTDYIKSAQSLIRNEKETESIARDMKSAGMGERDYASVITGTNNGNLSIYKEEAKKELAKSIPQNLAGVEDGKVFDVKKSLKIFGAGKTTRILAAIQSSQFRNSDAHKKWHQEKEEINSNRSFGKENFLKLARTASYYDTPEAEKKEALEKINEIIKNRDTYMLKNITEAGGTATPDSRATVKKWLSASNHVDQKGITDLL